MNPQKLESFNDIISTINKNSKGKFGIICLNCLMNKIRFKEIRKFLLKHNIPLPDKTLTKHQFLEYILFFFFQNYKENDYLKKEYTTSLEYIGILLTEDEIIKNYLTYFDFIAKQDLKDAFADYCADMGISVYDCSDNPDCNEDLYLIKRKPLLKTEGVFLRTGNQMEHLLMP